jgi:hypothetical protein
MNALLNRIWRSPRLSRILLALSMPAMVTIGFAPFWAIALCIFTIGLALVFMYAEVLSPKFIQNTSSRAAQNTLPPTLPISSALPMAAPVAQAIPKATLPAPVMSTEVVPGLLRAWAEYGSESSATLTSAQSEIREAIRMSTSSAIEVGHCVKQVQSNHDAHQSKQMALTAENAFYLVERQQMASLIALRVDDLLADADKAARELGMAALASQERTVKIDPSAQNEIDPLAFSKTYRNTIRELRTGLDAIRQSLAQATNDLQNNVNQLKGAANLGKAEVDTVARKIQVKLGETRQTMQRLSELSLDTDNHIRSAVVAMQYHDITTQKLAAVESSKLQVLLAHTQTMVANSYRQFPEISKVAAKPEWEPSKVEETEAPPKRSSHNELSDLALAELEKHSVKSTTQPATSNNKPHSIDLFE